MAMAGPQFTLVGFSPVLDWRPLRFVEPIPRTLVCGACGLVRRVTAHLPCQHVLCVFCYEQCAKGGDRVCPLDGHQFPDEGVNVHGIALDTLLLNQVRCWNDQSGCEAVMAASDLSEHFHNQCCYHSTICPTCSASILCRDVNAHLTSQCRSASLSDEPVLKKENDNAALVSLTGLLDQRTDHIKSGLQQILDDSKVFDQEIGEICSSIEALKEENGERVDYTSPLSRGSFVRNTAEPASSDERDGEPRNYLRIISRRISKLDQHLSQKLTYGSNRITKRLAGNAIRIDEMHSELLEASRDAMYCLELAVAQTSLQTTLYRFVVKEIDNLQANAARNGAAHFLGGRVYLRGYFMSPGVRLVAHADTAALHAWVVLHKGESDDSLEWPLEITGKFSVIHPDTGAEWVDSFMLPPCGMVSGLDARENEPALGAPLPSFLLNELQRDGFVKNDCLLLKYELI